MKPIYKIAVAFAALGVSSMPALAAVKSETITYQAGTVTAKSLLVYDTKFSGPRPGILVVPEWWGMTAHPKARAEMLAKMGYVALVADMYGDGESTDSPDEAGKLAGPLKAGDRAEMRARITAAYNQLKSNPMVDPNKIAAIGFCFGGTTVLELARSGADLAGVVSFHGGLDLGTAPAPTSIKPKVLILHGADDPTISPEQIKAATDELRVAKADWEFVEYSGAVHAFTNKDADRHHIPGVAYNAEADKRSWQAMQDFFKEIFKQS
jgi:dienelactone hydrolase